MAGDGVDCLDDLALRVLRGLSSLMAVPRRVGGCADAGVLAAADPDDAELVRLMTAGDGVPSMMLVRSASTADPMVAGRLLAAADVGASSVRQVVVYSMVVAGRRRRRRSDRDYARAVPAGSGLMPAVVRCLHDGLLDSAGRNRALRAVGRIVSSCVGEAEGLEGSDPWRACGYVAYVLSHVAAALACVGWSVGVSGLDVFKADDDASAPCGDAVWGGVVPWLMMMRARGLDAESAIRYMGAMKRSRGVSYDDVQALMGVDVFAHMAGMYASSAARIVDADFLMVSDADKDAVPVLVADRAVEAERMMHGLSSLREEDEGESASYAFESDQVDADFGDEDALHPLRVGWDLAYHVAYGHAPYGVVVRALAYSLYLGPKRNNWDKPFISIMIRDWEPTTDAVSMMGLLDGVTAAARPSSQSGSMVRGMLASGVEASLEYARRCSQRYDNEDHAYDDEPAGLDALRELTRKTLKHAEESDRTVFPAWWRLCHLFRMMSRRFRYGTIADGRCPLIRRSDLDAAIKGMYLSGLPADYCMETLNARMRMVSLDDVRERRTGTLMGGSGREPVLLAVDPEFMLATREASPPIMLIALDE